MFDLRTPIDELTGLSETTIEAVTPVITESVGDASVNSALWLICTIIGRRHLLAKAGRAAYADLCAELDDLGLVPLRWGLGVQEVSA